MAKITADKVQDLIDLEETTNGGVKNNKLANFSYTDIAYENNEAAGVDSYDSSQEQNIPNPSPVATETNQTVLDRGFRSQGASLSRMLTNHFFGRTSYNLNKIHDWFTDYLKTFKSFLNRGIWNLEKNTANEISDFDGVVEPGTYKGKDFTGISSESLPDWFMQSEHQLADFGYWTLIVEEGVDFKRQVLHYTRKSNGVFELGQYTAIRTMTLQPSGEIDSYGTWTSKSVEADHALAADNATEATHATNADEATHADNADKLNNISLIANSSSGYSWINSIYTGRNLVDVLGATDVKDAFSKLKQKSDSGDFFGLGLGDYLDIPSITVSEWGTFTLNPSYQNTRVHIVDFDHYYNSQNNFHQIVFQFKNVLTQKAMDSNNTNTGGYPAKQLYAKLNGDFTTGLQNAIGVSVKEIKKPFHTAKGSYKYDTPVKCFIPSETEIIGHQNVDQDPIWAGSGISQYALYSVAPQLITRKYNGSFAWWWLSSPYFAISIPFARVNRDGRVDGRSAHDTDGGVSPVFCI